MTHINDPEIFDETELYMRAENATELYQKMFPNATSKFHFLIITVLYLLGFAFCTSLDSFFLLVLFVLALHNIKYNVFCLV